MPPKRRTDGDATPTTTTPEPDIPPTQDAPQSPPPVTDDDRQAALSETVDRIMAEYGPALELLARMDASTGAPIPAIHPAFWAIMKDVQGVGKHGQMQGGGGNYQFRRYDDLKRELGASCRTNGVMLQSEVMDVVNERIDARKTRVQVTVRYRFTSLVDGSALAFESVGESIDTSDKASSKAMTMALKTALDQAFMLAAEDIDDPDAARPSVASDDVPREQRQQRRDQTVQRRDNVYREGDPVPPGGHQVGDRREVGGTTFVKHGDGPGYPNNNPGRGDAWDQGVPPAAPPTTPVDDRTPQQKAQAAADAASNPRLTLDDWNRINEAARELSLLDVVIRNSQGQEMALKHHLVAIGRTL